MELQSHEDNVVSKSCTVSSKTDATVLDDPTRAQKKWKLIIFNEMGRGGKKDSWNYYNSSALDSTKRI